MNLLGKQHISHRFKDHESLAPETSPTRCKPWEAPEAGTLRALAKGDAIGPPPLARTPPKGDCGTLCTRENCGDCGCFLFIIEV